MARTVRLELTANVSGLLNGLRTGGRAVSNFANDVNSFQQRNRQALDDIGSTAGRAGAAAAAGLGLVAKAAIDWESAFTGVQKTVDATDAQYAELEQGLRSLAKTLPSTHTEIAGVAEAAGQLGVARADIVGFTKTMIDLGETTNLTAEDAATQIAQISNVMGTMEREGSEGVSRFGAALVALGNDGASTEREILAMAQRIAGAGATLGASESDVLALSNTLASMGVNAELGGGVTTRVLLKMRTAVDEGGKSLDSFGRIAGLTADDFATKFREAPMEALDLVAKGISRVNDEGGNVTATLKEMGIKGTEETQVMLALAAAGDLLSDSLMLGNEAWDENAALLAEAEKRYGTTEAKISIAWNKIKDASIDAGASILPVVANLTDAVGGLADWFGDLPEPMQTFLTALGGIGAAAGLGIAGLTIVAKQLGSLHESFGAIYGSGGRAQDAIKGVGKALTGITIVGAGLIAGKAAIEGINEAARSGRPDLEEYFNILATGGDLGGFIKDNQLKSLNTIGSPINDIEQFKNSIEWLKGLDQIENPLLKWSTQNLTLFSRNEVNNALDLAESMKAVGRAFEMGEIDKGTKSLSDMASQMQLTDQQVADLINSVPELKSALMQLATDQGINIDPNNELGLVDLALGRIGSSAPGAASGIEEAKQKLADMGVAADGTVTELDKLLESMLALSTGTLNTRAAERQFQESIRGVTESIKENGKSLDETTAKGSANQAALDQVATSGLSVAAALAQAKDSQGNFANSQADVEKSLKATYDATMESAMAFTGNKEKAKELTRELLGIPEGVSVKTWMDTFARDTAQETTKSVAEIPGYTEVTVAVTEDGTVGEVQSKINEVTGKEEFIFVTDDGSSQVVQQAIANIDGKDVPVWVTDDGTVVATQAEIKGIDGTTAVVTVNDAGIPTVEQRLNHVARDRQSTVTVTTNKVENITKRIMPNQPSNGPGNGSITGQFGRRASGGSVFGPGTETSDSIPTLLSNNEHVWSAKEVRGAGGHSQIERMRALARQGLLPAFKSGGAIGRAQDKVDRLQRQYSRMPGDKKNRNRKLDLKDDLDAAKRELAAVKKSSKDAEKRAKDAKKKAFEERKAEAERQRRLYASRGELGADLRRGNIVDAFTSGSGLSQVDKLFGVSRNSDYSMGKRRQAWRNAASLEKSLASLTKKSEGLEKALEAAKSKADELRSVRDAVANDLRGEFSMSVMLDKTRKDMASNPFTAKTIASRANQTARRINIFAERLNRLRKLGYGETIIQEIVALGVDDGIYAAGALMNASKQERNNIIGAYGRLDRASGKAGQYVTESMYKGGLDAADGLVAGLESKTKNVESAFYKLGKNAEKSFKRSLGIKSPSRVMMAAGVNVGEGAELGILSKVGDVQSAAERLMSPPSLTIPPSMEVLRYAQAQAAPTFSAEAIAAAVKAGLAGWQPMVEIGGRKFYGVMKESENNFGGR